MVDANLVVGSCGGRGVMRNVYEGASRACRVVRLTSEQTRKPSRKIGRCRIIVTVYIGL